jgi:hypothetical protein
MSDASITSTTTAVSVSAFTGREVAPTGFRVVAVRYKETTAEDGKTKIAAKPAKVCIVPQIAVTVLEPVTLQQAVQDCVNELQDDLVRTLVNSGKILFAHSDCDATAIAAYAASVSTGKRLSKDSILAWFDSAVQDKLMAQLTTALSAGGNDVEVTKLVAAVERYRSSFLKLALPVPSVPQQDAVKMLEKASAATDQDSPVAKAVLAKLQVLAKPVVVEDLI